MKIFGTDIRKIIGDVTKSNLPPLVLTRVSPGTRDPNNLAGGTNPTEQSFSGEGVVTFVSKRTKEGLPSDIVARVTIVGQSIGDVTPRSGDRVTADGTTYVIKSVRTDPASASHVCEVAAR